MTTALNSSLDVKMVEGADRQQIEALSADLASFLRDAIGEP